LTDWTLTQSEADALLALPKKAASYDVYEYPAAGGRLSVPLVSHDGREEFLLDLQRGRIDFAKATYQNRARRVVPLARLDINGRPHTNPDGEMLSGTHLHLYREGHALTWAFTVSTDQFSRPDDLAAALDDFLRFCNVDPGPNITTRFIV
jgi:hypothetical protein